MAEGVRDVVSGAVSQGFGVCGSCISRRSFLADVATIAALAALFAGCADTGITDPTEPLEVKVGDFPGLATINQLVLVDGQRAAKRTGDATFAAFSRACTHEGTRINLSGSGFLCPNHGAQYDNNGNVTLGPASRSLTHLATSYDSATDTLTIG
jgi:Rieske Fe-S protein